MTAQVPATQGQPQRLSRVGKRPILIPKGITVNVSGTRFEVQGPKGKLGRELPGQVVILREGDALRVTTTAPGRDAARLQGLARALIAAMIKGVGEGYTRILELVGTGYRAEVKGQILTMQVGLSHPVIMDLPASVSATVPPDSKGTQIVMTSPDKELLGRLSSTLRSRRPPEPYGGKGVRFRGEVLRRKAGKAGKKAGGA
jgi:large subunit ribosomal protein L6